MKYSKLDDSFLKNTKNLYLLLKFTNEENIDEETRSNKIKYINVAFSYLIENIKRHYRNNNFAEYKQLFSDVLKMLDNYNKEENKDSVKLGSRQENEDLIKKHILNYLREKNPEVKEKRLKLITKLKYLILANFAHDYKNLKQKGIIYHNVPGVCAEYGKSTMEYSKVTYDIIRKNKDKTLEETVYLINKETKYVFKNNYFFMENIVMLADTEYMKYYFVINQFAKKCESEKIEFSNGSTLNDVLKYSPQYLDALRKYVNDENMTISDMENENISLQNLSRVIYFLRDIDPALYEAYKAKDVKKSVKFDKNFSVLKEICENKEFTVIDFYNNLPGIFKETFPDGIYFYLQKIHSPHLKTLTSYVYNNFIFNSVLMIKFDEFLDSDEQIFGLNVTREDKLIVKDYLEAFKLPFVDSIYFEVFKKYLFNNKEFLEEFNKKLADEQNKTV